jgi:hypothetical protein
MDEYSIEDEASIVAGHIISLKRLAESEKEDYSFFHTDKLVAMRYAALFADYRRRFFEASAVAR